MPFVEARLALAGLTLESVEVTMRAARALRTLEERGLASTADCPLLLHLDRILDHAEPVDIPWESFAPTP